MTANRPNGVTILTIFTCLMAAPVFAQVDHRVRNNTERGAGRALDANKQVGSGGFNQSAPNQYRFDYGQRAGEIITGNVTGLAGFQGYSPIVANNAFRIGLPTAGLAQFRASTVGLPEVTSGWLNQGPGSYYDTQQIIPDAGSYSRGMNLSGSNMAGSPYRRPPTPYERDLQQQYLLPTPGDTRIQPTPNISPRFRQTTIVPDSDASPGAQASLMSPYANAAGSSIFGAPAFNQPRSLYPNNQTANPMGLNPAAASKLASPINRPDKPLASDTPIGSKSPFSTEPQQGDSPALAPGDARSPLAGPSVASGPMGPDGKPLVSSMKSTAISGGDRFLDMVAAVQAAQSAGVTNLGFVARSKGPAADATKAPPVGISTKPESKTTDGVKPQAPVTDKSVSEMASAAKWVGKTLEDPIKTFTGHYQGKLNDHMARAEDALHRGQYYTAAREYELASTIDPSNPLPLLGRGHALAAAGDYMSAVVSIERGIARFPQIAAFRIDLPAIVGRPDAFDIRRADLESRLESSEDYRLRFLLGYLEIYSGLMERGLRDLDTAAQKAPTNSMIALFPEMITGRKPVPELRE